MRSGTSAFMQGLQAGGMPICFSQSREAYCKTNCQGVYNPNPKGMFEIDRVDLESNSFTDGAAIKVVDNDLQFLAILPERKYKVAILLRDSEEIRQSLEAAFKIKYPVSYIQSIKQDITEYFENRKGILDIKLIQHKDLMCEPENVFKELNWPLDYKLAANEIDNNLYRFRKENLVVGL